MDLRFKEIEKILNGTTTPGKSWRHDDFNNDKQNPSPRPLYRDAMVDKFLRSDVSTTIDKFIRYQDPTILGYKVLFDFINIDSHLLVGPVDDSIDEITSKTDTVENTALHYLKMRGEYERANYLYRFQKLLQKISSETPWYFQSLEGLDEAWKRMNEVDDYKAALPNDRKITINTLDETIDFRLTALIDLYRKACFDFSNRREIVPRNLRRFNMSIFVYDARSINRFGDTSNPHYITTKEEAKNSALSGITKANWTESNNLFGADEMWNADANSRQLDYANQNISRVLFRFTLCEFLPDESNSVFSGLSNKEMVLKAQKFVISYRNVIEENLFRMFHNRIVADSFLGAFSALAISTVTDIPPDVTPEIPQQSDSFIAGFKKSLYDSAKNRLNNIIAPFKGFRDKTDLPNGNAYGRSLIDEITGGNPLLGAAANRLVDEVKGAVISGDNVIADMYKKFFGNVYDLNSSFAMMVEMIKNPQSLVNAALDSITEQQFPNGDGFNASLSNTDPVGSPTQQSVSGVSLSNKTKDLNSDIVSVGNNISINLGSIYSTSPSLTNDDGKDVTSSTEPVQNPQVSLTNNTQPYSPTPTTGGGGAGGGAVGAPPSVGEVYLGSASLTNDDGKDSTYTTPGNSQSSLSNDNGPDAN